MTHAAIDDLALECYSPHHLHAPGRTWLESNCYIDMWIEVLHALRLEPLACMGFTLASDFEGDQWTFAKPSPYDLLTLYGLDIRELTVWRSLAEYLHEQVRRGRFVVMEADAYYLPDTLATTYHAEHAKTSIGVNSIGLEARQLRYFHGSGYHSISGADFDGLFKHGEHASAEPVLTPYVELVKLDRIARYPDKELAERSVMAARAHLSCRSRANPAAAFGRRLIDDLCWLAENGLDAFHRYAFAMLRQLGAVHELGAAYLGWMIAHGYPELGPAQGSFETIARTAMTLQLKLARVAGGRRAPDLEPSLATLARAWDDASNSLFHWAEHLSDSSITTAG